MSQMTSTATPNLKPRSLVMVITELDRGGAEQAFVRVAIGLKDRGWTVSAVSLRDAGPLAEELTSSGIPVTALNCRGLLDLRAIWRLWQLLRRDRPDVVLSFLHQANLVSRIAAKLAGVKRVVSSVRVADRRWLVTWPDRVTRWMVSHYTAVSRAVADVHVAACSIRPDRMTVIRNGVDLAAIDTVDMADRNQLGLDGNDFVILVVGRLTEQKRPHDVLAAFAKLREMPEVDRSRLKLLFAGEGPLRAELRHQIQSRQLADCVQLLGHRSDVIALMKMSNVLVLASSWEGLPNVILEAHAARLPVIASRVDGNTEVVTDRVTGRLFDRGDVEQLAGCLTEAVQQQSRSKSWAASGRQFVEERFRWHSCIKHFDRQLTNDRLDND